MEEKMHYNLSNLKNMVGDDPDVILEFINLFVDTSAQTLSDLNNAHNAKDYPTVGSLAHKLKSSVDLMGIESLYDTIRIIERSGKEQINIPSLPDHFSKLNDVLEIVYRQMKTDFNLK